MFDDKLVAAARLRDELGITRPILVDDFEGALHRAYGGLPNMSWVLGRGGVILYKAMWTSADRHGSRTLLLPAARGAAPELPAVSRKDSRSAIHML